MAKKGLLSEKSHPKYDDLVSSWEFFLQSVKGGSDYTEGDNLFSHRLESQEDDFTNRKDRAYYLNFCDAICSMYTHYIMKEAIERPADTNLEEFRNNIDLAGNDINVFMTRVGYMSSFYGHIHVLVDMPSDETINSMTKKDLKDKRINPYCKIITPISLKDWSLDSNDVLNWIVVEESEYNDADPNSKREEISTYKLITRDEWRVEDEKGNNLRSGPNNLGEVPLITCYHKDIFGDKMVGESLIKDIAYVNRIIFNWCSCIDEMIERQTFSQLVVPDNGFLTNEEGGGGSPLKRIGTSSIWTFPADSSNPPKFISPDTDNITVIWDLIVAHVREIHRLAGLTGVSEDIYTAQRSGRSQQYGFLNISTSLAAKARNLEIAENRINNFAYKWLSKTPETYRNVVYPKKFEVEGLAQSITETFTIVEREVSKRLNKELLKKLAAKALPTATEDVKGEIDKEIEAGDGTIVPIQVAQGGLDPNAVSDGEGRPAGSVDSTKHDSGEVKKSLEASRKTSGGTTGGKPRK